MKIKNTSGQYWTGSCWGVEQNAEEYAIIDDLPTWIESTGRGDLTIEIHSEDDIRYYQDYSEDAEASVVA